MSLLMLIEHVFKAFKKWGEKKKLDCNLNPQGKWMFYGRHCNYKSSDWKHIICAVY